MFRKPKTSTSNYKHTQTQASYTERLTDYLIDKRKHVTILLSLLVIVVSAIVAWSHYQEQKNTIAQNEMYQANYDFDAGNFEKALTGDKSYAGFLDIMQNYRF